MATIHINPANKGKFTATKRRTGKSTEELTHSKNPLTRKRAIFAQNAKKWHHADGGELFGADGYQDHGFGMNQPDYACGGNMYFLGGIKPPTAIQGSVGNVAGSIGGLIPTDTKGGAATSGALKGAELGMNFGPWGAAAGAVLGGAAGFISQDNKMKKADFASDAMDMRQRNEMLGIKANGGKINKYDVKDSSVFNDWYNAQPFYTEALGNKYKDLPVKNILGNASNDKSFSNRKLNNYNDSLVSRYGDKYLTEAEVDSVSKLNNIPNIFDLDNKMKESDSIGAGVINNTTGSKENKLNKYGYRMMLNRSFPKGSSPYKASGGYILPQGVSSNMATEYAQGGMLTDDSFEFITSDGRKLKFY